MIKYSLTYLFCLVLLNQINGQVTIDHKDFISKEDTVLISEVINFENIDLQKTGPNYLWDYSFLKSNAIRIDTFFSPVSLPILYQLLFNNFLIPDLQASYFIKEDDSPLASGGMPINAENPISLFQISENLVAHVGYGTDINNLPLPIAADTVDEIYQLPLTYQDKWTSNSSYNFDLNPAIDVVYKRYQIRESEVDGYGDITTPFGTFESIRVKSILTFHDSIYIDPFGTGGTWIALPLTSEIEYRWLAKNNKIPILSINSTKDRGDENITSVEYRTKIDYTNITKEKERNSFFTIYPNPTNNVTQIKLKEVSNGKVTFYSLDGKTIFTTNIESSTITIDCTRWVKGAYIFELQVNEKIYQEKLIVQ